MTTINLKFLLQIGMMNLIYLMDHILFQTFKTILNTSLKNMKPGENTDCDSEKVRTHLLLTKVYLRWLIILIQELPSYAHYLLK